MTAEDVTPEPRWRRWVNSWRRGSVEDQRLNGAIDDCAVQLGQRGIPDAGWTKRAEDYLARAMAQRTAGEMDTAWSNLKAAQRELIGSFDETELRIDVVRVSTEVHAKLSGWRLEMVNHTLEEPWICRGDAAIVREAVTTALAELAIDPATSGSDDLRRRIGLALTKPEPRGKSEELDELRIRLREAREVLEEHQDNLYRKLRILRVHVRWASIFLFVAIVLTLGVLATGWKAMNGPTLFSDWHSVVVVMALGTLGAAVSGVLAPLSRDQNQQIPDVLSQSKIAGVRLLVGAGAAVIVVAIVRSGIAGISIDAAAVPVAALAAGFSERLVGQSVAAASAALGK